MNKNLHLIFRELFYILSLTLVVFTLMEVAAPNIVQAYFSLNVILILWLGSGMVLLLLKLKS